MLDPSDPAVIEQARKNDIPDAWITAAQKSPVYKAGEGGRWLCPAPRVPHHAHGLVRAAAVSDC